MTIAVGANTYQTGTYTTGNPVAAPSINTSASGSSFIVFAVGFQSGLSFTVGDNKGNNGNYIQQGTVSSDTLDGISMGCYLCTNGTGGSGHVVNLSTTVNGVGVAFYVAEITGGAISSLVDVINGCNEGFLGTPTSNPVTTTNANDLILCCLQNNTTTLTSITPANGFTLVNSDLTTGNGLMQLLVSSAGIYDPNPNRSPTGGVVQIVTIALKAFSSNAASIAWVV